MKKFLSIFVALLAVFLMASCASDDSTSTNESAKPRRQTSGGSLPWARPADWEGGLPGMGGINNGGQRNY